jgi:hypothetical protein
VYFSLVTSNLAMLNKSIIIILTIGLCLDLKAQKADYTTIRESIEAKFWVSLDTVNLCETVIFNGIVYDSSELDKELRKYKQSEIIVTELADLSGSRLIHKNCDYLILLGTGYNQSDDDKKRILDSIRDNLNESVPELIIHDFLCSKCMQVIIDGRPYGIYQAKKIVNQLKVSDVKYIAEYKSANLAVYGQNAKNGMIEIFLKKKNKKNW